MTPKEKAQEIVFKMFAEWMQIPYEAVSYHLRIPGYTLGLEWNMTKHCALIAVDEIIEATSIKYEYRDAQIFYAGKKPMQYWLDVKNEIEKL